MLTPRVTETRRAGSTEPHFERHLASGSRVLPSYAAQVMARYRRASVEYGETWRTRPLSAICGEVAEEGLDVGGWAMFVPVRVDELRPEVRGEAVQLAADLVALGAQVSAKAARLEALIRHAGT